MPTAGRGRTPQWTSRPGSYRSGAVCLEVVIGRLGGELLLVPGELRSLVAAGTDIVLTTHYLEEADELADQVVVIDHGKAVAAGTTAELKAGIGRAVIEAALADGAQLGAAAAVLETLTAGQAVVDQVGRRVQSQASDGTAQLSAAIAALDSARIPVTEIALRHPTLDEVFLTLTTTTDTKSGGVR